MDAADDEMDAEMDMGDVEADPAPEAGPEAALPEDAIQAAVSALSDIEALLQPLADAAGISMEDEEAVDDLEDMSGMGMDLEPAADEEDADLEGDAEMDMDMAAGEEEELVMEVAKRVARRIMKARKAQRVLNKALGTKSTK